MESYFIPLLCLVIGSFFIIRNVNHLKNESLIRSYLQRNPKAKLWVNYLGYDRTFTLAKRVLLPFGCVLGLGMWVFGTLVLLHIAAI